MPVAVEYARSRFLVSTAPADIAEEQAFADTGDADDEDEASIPTGRYNVKRLTARLEATR